MRVLQRRLMKKAGFLAFYWLPPVLLMALIFYLSSLSGLPDFEEYDFAMKKTAHLSVYAFLYLLLFRAFYSVGRDAAGSRFRSHLASAVIAILYAVSDEIHQYFVPFRTSTIRDVLIDTAGVALMCVLISRWPALFSRLLRGPAVSPRPDGQPR
jgi:VanZ family protein